MQETGSFLGCSTSVQISPQRPTADLVPPELQDRMCVVLTHKVGGNLLQQQGEADTLGRAPVPGLCGDGDSCSDTDAG